MEEKEYETLLRTYLTSFPLYDPSHVILVKVSDEGTIHLSYYFVERDVFGARFDLQISDTLCYLLWIGISKQHRGKGLGSQLYTLIENFAAEVGCTTLRITPSGETFSGKDRRDYLLRRGYRDFDRFEVEKYLAR